MAEEAAFDLADGPAPVLALRGDWTVDTISGLSRRLAAVVGELSKAPAVDVSKLGRIDVAGAYLLNSVAGVERPLTLRGEHPTASRVIEVARAASKPPAAPPEQLHGWRRLLERIGRGVAAIGEEIIETVGFMGQTLLVLGGVLARPARIRWTSVVHTMEFAGLHALPIVMLLSFFIGLVVAYLGARILGDFGASVFTVELVAFSVMREFAVVITAVLLAGRTNSAFTAEIGAMKMRQEIDAMRVMGIDPMESLVVPRVIAMVLMLPILTFGAVIAGLAGGLLVSWGALGVSPAMFFSRIGDAVPQQHFWVGMSKAPVFAFMLAIIGCRNGLEVGDDVSSLGRRTTTSVVQAIFLVILIDAIFALWYLELDL